MKLPLFTTLALASFVAYVNVTKADNDFVVSSAHLEDYSSASIVESSHDDTDLYFAFRAARGDGMTASGVRVRGELRPGALDASQIQVTQQWRPHIGAWSGSHEAERVVAEVNELNDGSMRVAYVAYFGDATSHGAFVVRRPEGRQRRLAPNKLNHLVAILVRPTRSGCQAMGLRPRSSLLFKQSLA